MINLILSKINNYFYKFYEVGEYEIIDSTLQVKGEYFKGQYIRIEGSTLNDGVHLVTKVDNDIITVSDLTTEGFEGTISSLAIPKDVLSVIPRLEQFNNDNKPSNIVSESFGTYSYSMKQESTWWDAFKGELMQYRKMYDNKRGVKYVK